MADCALQGRYRVAHTSSLTHMQIPAGHLARRERLQMEFAASDGAIRLRKPTSNLFRHRNSSEKRRVDVREFNHVLSIDRERRVAEVEGMTTYEILVNETLKYGLLPAVVPQLKTITVGGGGSITLQGGSSTGTNVGVETVNAPNVSNGSFASIFADGDAQLVQFSAPGGSISVTGGTVGSNNLASIEARHGTQTIQGTVAANVPSITLTAGASGGVATRRKPPKRNSVPRKLCATINPTLTQQPRRRS